MGKKLIWCIAFGILVLPSVLYFLIFGYLLLFTNHAIDGIKMYITGVFALIGISTFAALADIGGVWK